MQTCLEITSKMYLLSYEIWGVDLRALPVSPRYQMSYDAVVVMVTTLFILNSKWLRKSHIILWLLSGDHITNIKSLILIYFLLLSSFLLFFQSEKALELRLALVPQWENEQGHKGPEQKPNSSATHVKKKEYDNQQGSSRITTTAAVYLFRHPKPNFTKLMVQELPHMYCPGWRWHLQGEMVGVQRCIHLRSSKRCITLK